MKTSLMFSKGGPKIARISFYLKRDAFKTTQKLLSIWATFGRKNVTETFQK